MTIFTIKKLPWEENALEPVISAKTIFHHYHKHHAGYVEKLNVLLDTLRKEHNLEQMTLMQIISDFKNSDHSDALCMQKKAIWNNAAQHYNHEFYWDGLSAEVIKPNDSKLIDAISANFENVESLNTNLLNASLSVFGSGWVWLTIDTAGKLHIEKTSNADQPMHKPLLVLDIWEHAYYLDYQQNRAEHIKALLGKINWAKVAERMYI